MRSLVRIGIFTVAMVAVVGVGFAQTSPKLTIDPMVVDLGEVPEGEVLTVTFKMRNEGDGLLTVKAVRPTCGCTVADFDQTVAPGTEGKVEAKLDTTGFKGAITKSVLLMTDDPINPTITLAIKAVVQPFIEVLPRPIVQFNALQLEEVEQKVTLVATERTKDFKVTEVSSDNESITTSVRKLDKNELVEGKPEPQYELTVTLAANAPEGTLNSTIIVETNSAKARKVQIRVFGKVRAILGVSPPELQFGQVIASQNPARNVIIVNNKVGEPIEILSASIDDPAFSAQLVEKDKGKRYQVVVSVNPEAEPGVKDVVLTLKTTDPLKKVVTVPVRANLS